MIKRIFKWLWIIFLVILIWCVLFQIYKTVCYKIKINKEIERYDNLPYHEMIEVYAKPWTNVDNIWGIVGELNFDVVDVMETKSMDWYVSEFNIPNDTVVYEIWFKEAPYCGGLDWSNGCAFLVEAYDFVYNAFYTEYVSPRAALLQ